MDPDGFMEIFFYMALYLIGASNVCEEEQTCIGQMKMKNMIIIMKQKK